MTIKKVAIVGCGAMGSGIAQVVLQGGYEVVVRETEETLLAKGLERVKGSLEKLVRKQAVTPEAKEEALKRLTGAVSLEPLADSDLIIEAIFEDLPLKMGLFKDLDAMCKKETIFASNTSSLPITRMAAATSRKEQFVGMHFFQPAPLMPLVEIVKTIATGPQTLQTVLEFAKSLGKVPVVAKDNAGFIVNLLLTPYLMDAVRALGEGVASIDHLDMAMKLGCNHPMGPLMLCDFIGLDVLFKGATTMYEEYKEKRYAPPPILKRMVSIGCLGLKSGKGFYDWSDPRNPVPADLGF
ncbi:MAG: 3-hydroxyacyl-CoA dehydrogenase family protein [Deltaproteobacteria bacterium]|nr:3-hydroxyacyl-CoA dehydrogenase family protein [Deltaproteobacteria bacterium]